MQEERRRGADGLEGLRERAGRIVGEYARGGEFRVPRAEGASTGGRRSRVGDGGGATIVGRQRVIDGGGAVTVNVSLSGGPIFLDDERRIRALAKEIKRLIGEDRRRGLGMGG